MVYVKKNKQKKIYICPNCLKDFENDKFHFNRHINRVFPCKKNNSNNSNNDENDINDDENDINDNENDINNDDLNDKNIILNGGNNNDLIFELMKKMNLIIEQNEKLKNELKKIKKTPKNTTNYTLNLNLQINNYNDTKDFKGCIEYYLNQKPEYHGKQIYLKPIKNIYFNPKKPENHNLYIADKNRGYAKVYNDGEWSTLNIDIIDEIINNVVDYYRLSIEKIKNDPVIYEKYKNNLYKKLQYVDCCDLDFLADLEEKQINDGIDNKDQIKRCLKFRETVYKDLKNLLNDNKKMVLKTHKMINNDIIDV